VGGIIQGKAFHTETFKEALYFALDKTYNPLTDHHQ
jgi:hypothetical protein